MSQDALLFSSGDLFAALEQAKHGVLKEVADAPEDYLLNVDIDEWVAHLVETHSCIPLVLNREDMYVEDLGETGVAGGSNYTAGRAAVLHIPFAGDPQLLQLRPGTFTYNPPRAGVIGQDIVKRFAWGSTRPDLAAEAKDLADTIEKWMGWSSTTVKAYNEELEPLARSAITKRRERVLGDHAHLDDLGIPVRRRGDAPTTYAAPGVARRQPPVPIARSEPPRMPEPTMVGALYDHTVGLIRSWARAVERTPAPYRDADEETLRDALLPMLNSHYEGSATGETFNAAGKTDILIRVEDRTIFVGECKWWSGPAGVGDALEQLFSYTTWRDTKLALVFFVDRADPVRVVDAARQALEASEHFLEWQDSGEDRELRCSMRWPGDDSIVAQLHVFFVHLPK